MPSILKLESSVGDVARFFDPTSGIAQINRFAGQLKRLGITSGVNITIGTNRANASDGSIQYGTIGALLTARANYIQQLFANGVL